MATNDYDEGHGMPEEDMRNSNGPEHPGGGASRNETRGQNQNRTQSRTIPPPNAEAAGGLNDMIDLTLSPTPDPSVADSDAENASNDEAQPRTFEAGTSRLLAQIRDAGARPGAGPADFGESSDLVLPTPLQGSRIGVLSQRAAGIHAQPLDIPDWDESPPRVTVFDVGVPHIGSDGNDTVAAQDVRLPELNEQSDQRQRSDRSKAEKRDQKPQDDEEGDSDDEDEEEEEEEENSSPKRHDDDIEVDEVEMDDKVEDRRKRKQAERDESDSLDSLDTNSDEDPLPSSSTSPDSPNSPDTTLISPVPSRHRHVHFMPDSSGIADSSIVDSADITAEDSSPKRQRTDSGTEESPVKPSGPPDSSFSDSSSGTGDSEAEDDGRMREWLERLAKSRPRWLGAHQVKPPSEILLQAELSPINSPGETSPSARGAPASSQGTAPGGAASSAATAAELRDLSRQLHDAEAANGKLAHALELEREVGRQHSVLLTKQAARIAELEQAAQTRELELAAQLEEARGNAAQLEDDVAQLRQEGTELRSQLLVVEASVEELTNENARSAVLLRAEKDARTRDIERADNQTRSLKRELSGAREHLAETQVELTTTQAELSALKTTQERLRADIAGHQTEEATLRTRLEDARVRRRRDMEAAADRERALLAANAELNDKFERAAKAARSTETELRARIGALTMQAAEAARTAEARQAEVESSRAEVSRLGTQLSLRTERIDQLVAQAEARDRELTAARDDLGAARVELGKARESGAHRAEQLEASLVLSARKLEETENSAREERERLMAAHVAELARTRQAADVELAAVRKRAAVAEARARTETQALELAVAAARDEAADARAALETAETAGRAAQARISALGAQLKDTRAAAAAAEGQLADAETRARGFQRQTEAAATAHDALLAKIATLERALSQQSVRLSESGSASTIEELRAQARDGARAQEEVNAARQKWAAEAAQWASDASQWAAERVQLHARVQELEAAAQQLDSARQRAQAELEAARAGAQAREEQFRASVEGAHNSEVAALRAAFEYSYGLLERTLETTRAELAELAARSEELAQARVRERGELRAQLDGGSDAAESARREAELARREADNARQDAEAAHLEATRLQKLADKLSSEVGALGTQLDEASRVSAEKLDAANARATKLEAAVAERDDLMARAEAEYGRMQAEVARLGSEVVRLEAAGKDGAELGARLGAARSELDTTRSELGADLARVRTELSQTKAELGALRTEYFRDSENLQNIMTYRVKQTQSLLFMKRLYDKTFPIPLQASPRRVEPLVALQRAFVKVFALVRMRRAGLDPVKRRAAESELDLVRARS